MEADGQQITQQIHFKILDMIFQAINYYLGKKHLLSLCGYVELFFLRRFKNYTKWPGSSATLLHLF